MSEDEINERFAKLSEKHNFKRMIQFLFGIGNSHTVRRENQYYSTIIKEPSDGNPKYSVRFEMIHDLSDGFILRYVHYVWRTLEPFSYSKEHHKINGNPLMISYSSKRTMLVSELLDKLYEDPPGVVMGG